MADNTIIITKNYEQMSQEAAKQIITTIKKHPEGLYCFAGGDTPVRTLQLLVEAHNNKEIDLTKAFYIELDEWVGLDQSDSGSCLSYLKKNLFDIADIPDRQIHSFDSLANDLKEECVKADTYIDSHGGITLSLLGVGVNGHLGFNEPGVDFDNNAHVINLDEKTQTVGQKYFESEKKLAQGITLGIKQLLASKVLIVEANGSKKREALRHLSKKVVDNNWPVTVVTKHPNCYLFFDEEAFEK
ncbi:MAG: glucosamine-6-phosphate deaminase [Coprobacillaceae bacterium]